MGEGRERVNRVAKSPLGHQMPRMEPKLELEDAYLYGATIREARWEGADLRVEVGYPENPEFFELQPLLNLRSASLVFRGVNQRDERWVAGRAGLLRRVVSYGTARDFVRDWEAAEAAWSLAGVAAHESGGFVMSVRESGDFYVRARGCELDDLVVVPGRIPAGSHT